MSDRQWWMVYEVASGRSVSLGTSVSPSLPASLTATPLPEADAEAILSGRAIWDAATRTVVPAPAAVPGEVTPYQFRVWLLDHGITMAQIDGMIAAIPDAAARERARVAWEYGLVVRRGDPMVAQFGAALGFDAAAIDAAFIEASQIA